MHPQGRQEPGPRSPTPVTSCEPPKKWQVSSVPLSPFPTGLAPASPWCLFLILKVFFLWHYCVVQHTSPRPERQGRFRGWPSHISCFHGLAGIVSLRCWGCCVFPLPGCWMTGYSPPSAADLSLVDTRMCMDTSHRDVAPRANPCLLAKLWPGDCEDKIVLLQKKLFFFSSYICML